MFLWQLHEIINSLRGKLTYKQCPILTILSVNFLTANFLKADNATSFPDVLLCQHQFLTHFSFSGLFPKGYKYDDRKREGTTTGLLSAGPLSECKHAISSCLESPLNATSSRVGCRLSQHQLTHQDKSPLMWTNNQVRAGVGSIEARAHCRWWAEETRKEQRL